MKSFQRMLAGVAVITMMAGCDSYSTAEASPFAGTYNGTWVAVNDPSDAGTSVWTISSAGAVSGTDVDPTLGISYNVVGYINPQGQVTTTATPNNGTGAATLNGTLQFETANRLAGNLVWGVQPPATYRYVLNR